MPGRPLGSGQMQRQRLQTPSGPYVTEDVVQRQQSTPLWGQATRWFPTYLTTAEPTCPAWLLGKPTTPAVEGQSIKGVVEPEPRHGEARGALCYRRVTWLRQAP